VEYHFCPVALADIPELVSAINVFGKVATDKTWTKDTLSQVAKIIQLSLKKAHGEVPIDTILQQFDFGSLAKSVRIAISLNDFLSEVQAIQEMFQTNQKTTSH
jgi:hypothetical protein